MDKKLFGHYGEKIALRYLQQKHFEVIEQNFSCKWGEIDLIAIKNNKIYFIEVKTRSSLRKGRPELAVRRKKFLTLTRVCYIYLGKYQLHNYAWQIDVLSILYNRNQQIARIRHFPNICIDTKYGYQVR